MGEADPAPPYADVGAIVVAAGRGERFGDPDKVLRDIAGRPMLLWSLHAVAAVAERVVVVTRRDLVRRVGSILEGMPERARYGVVAGGDRRQDSVRSGLMTLAGERTEIVAVQDAARPLTTAGLVRATVDSARRRGSGVAARRIADTVKEADGEGLVSRTLDRSRLWRVETPQTFRWELLARALDHVHAAGIAVTDDAGAVEQLGEPVRLVDASPWGPNDKITTPDDLQRVEFALRRAAP